MMFFAFACGMILSSLLNQFERGENTESDAREILFVYRGVDKYKEDLVTEDREKLAKNAEEKRQILENAALRQFLLDEAQKLNVSLTQQIEQSMPWKSVSEEDVLLFYETNQELIGKPLSAVKDEIKRKLERQRIKSAKEQLIKRLTEQGNLVFSL